MFNACVRNEKGDFCNSLVEHRHECVHFLHTDDYTRCEYAEDAQGSRAVCKCSAAKKSSRTEHYDPDYSLCYKKGKLFVCVAAGFYTESECSYSDMDERTCKFLDYPSRVCTNDEAKLEAEMKDL